MIRCVSRMLPAVVGTVLGLASISPPASAQNADLSTKVDYNTFKTPPAEFRGTIWFTFGMNNMNDQWVKSQIERATQDDSYGQWMATPSGGGGGGGFGGGAGRGRRGGPATGQAEAQQQPAPPPAPTGPTASYLNDEFFRVYKVAIEEGLKKNMPLRILYDEQQFPTGFAGGLFRQKYPNLIGKSLDKVEQDVKGPTKVELAAPGAPPAGAGGRGPRLGPIDNGTYIGAVLLNLDTLETVDVSSSRVGDKIAASINVPAGNWKAMLFFLDPNANTRGLVDYLDPVAVDGLINVMYQKYYDNLKQYFGTVIKMTFYDEPGMQHPEFKGRLWTARFNDDFQKKYGYNPMKLYPALWYDIGPNTASARNALFGYRAEMYAENFIGRVAKWCEDHGVKMAGHLDQEEAMSPVCTQGDLMKVFKRQQVPGHDDIWWVGRSNMSYKIMTSSAFNWDKPIAIAETYAAYRGPYQNPESAYRTAMDQHAMGVNFQVGNYPFMNPQPARGGAPTSQPSYRHLGPEFGAFLGRMQYLLQHGRHVADIGVLYPIAAMQSAYRFSDARRVTTRSQNPDPSTAFFYYALEGGIIPPEIDYMQLGEMLYRGYKVDYTYLHPEIVESNTSVQDGKLILDNKENREEFRVIIIPGGDTIGFGVAKKIQEFYDAGGAVICTSKIPTKAVEMGKDKDVQKIMDDIFGLPDRGPITADLRANTDLFKIWFSHPNQKGGQAFFVPRLDVTMLTDALNTCDPIRDVNIKMDPVFPVKVLTEYEGALTYIHKVKDGKDIYFFANSTNNPVDTDVVLRGDKKLAMWNPHTGEKIHAETQNDEASGQKVTTIHLSLQPVKSVFFVSE